MSFNFQKLDLESAEAIHFETAINVLSRENNRTFLDTAIVLSRAINSFQEKNSNNNINSFQKNYLFGEIKFRLYDYNPTSGFNIEDQSAKQHSFFLNEIAKGSDYHNGSDSNHSNIYYLKNEYGNEYATCYPFYFKLSEFLVYLLHNNFKIPAEFEHALPEAEKMLKLHQEEQRLDFIDYMNGDEDEDEGKDLSLGGSEIQWSKFAGKDTALKLIAGMAIALEKTNGKYVRGKNLINQRYQEQ